MQALPAANFIECDVEQFDATARTTKGILGLASLSPEQRVALTILKKLYAQRGTGRKESALFRGLDAKHRDVVPAVLDALRAERLAASAKQGSTVIWLPTKGHGLRVKKMLESGGTLPDPLMDALK